MATMLHSGTELALMEVESCVPPGFRFHPTEEELVGYYLTRKVASQCIDLNVIADIDLYAIEPWDLQDRCKHGNEEQTEWYFFSHKDRKYPSGTRTNRATAAGFWKATGRDKAVLSRGKVIGMRKTLVYYKGRAPNGRKSEWIMHEYRLQSREHAPPQEEGWVVCRAFKKPIPNQNQCFNTSNPTYYIRDHDHQFGVESLTGTTCTTRFMDSYPRGNFQEQQFGCGDELESKQSTLLIDVLPQLNSPSLSASLAAQDSFEPSVIASEEHSSQRYEHCGGQFIDWKVLDKLLASQLSEAASCSNTNTPTIPTNYIADADQSQGDHFFTSFHSL